MASDDEYEEEIICVDLDASYNLNWSNFIGTSCKFIGLDSDEVVMQLGKHIFKGSFGEAIGTRLLIDKDDCNANPLKTYKTLDMKKIFIHEKTDEEKAGTSEQGNEIVINDHSEENGNQPNK